MCLSWRTEGLVQRFWRGVKIIVSVVDDVLRVGGSLGWGWVGGVVKECKTVWQKTTVRIHVWIWKVEAFIVLSSMWICKVDRPDTG